MEKVIEVKNVVKRYKLYKNSGEKLKGLFNKEKYGEDFYALNGVDFSAEKGDVIGFIGINGSGKSTLSNILAGIVPETSGEIITRGQVSLIAVASGLNNELTGRDNIELKCLMLGFSKEEIEELEDEIIEFSELGQFIDQPVKSYSSGMKSRLGFAISVSVDPDILIIDEALSVGDKAFAEKSLTKMKEFKELGKTMIFVSHSLGQMRQFCDKILWLEFGKVKAFGNVNEVLSLYETFLNKWQKMTKEERDNYRVQAQNKQNKNKIETENYILYVNGDEKIEPTDEYEVLPISKIGHIAAGKSFIYSAPNTEKDLKSSERFKHKSYYIKRQANFRFETYYLLSTKPSGIDGIVGWMKKEDLITHNFIHVDYDKKKVFLTGEGIAYDTPWGGKRQIMFEQLDSYKNQELIVIETVLIKNNTWLKCIFCSDIVWIRSVYVCDKK